MIIRQICSDHGIFAPKGKIRAQMVERICQVLDNDLVDKAISTAISLALNAFLNSNKTLSASISSAEFVQKKLVDPALKSKLKEQVIDLAAKIAAREVLKRIRHIAARYTKVVVPKIGSVLYCDLLGFFEHTGVYIGNNQIVHRDGKGFIAVVSPKEFLARLDGRNPAKSIFVACRGNEVYGSSVAAKRAIAAIHDPKFKGYNLLFKNCHQFTQYCLTEHTSELGDFAFTHLQNLLYKSANIDSWYLWQSSSRH